jgi:hypothetical protein
MLLTLSQSHEQEGKHSMAKDESPPSRTPIEHARDKAGKVQQDLQVAGAELGLAHDALERHVPAQVKTNDVAWAIGQNAAVGRKLDEAVEELEEVTELLHEEAAERERLEERLNGGS